MTAKSFFIGDVHGCDTLLRSVLSKIEDICAGDAEAPVVHFLGDIVDRGVDSRTCLDLVGQTLEKWNRSIFVRGNHDQMFLDVLEGIATKKRADFWYDEVGGFDTCASYDGAMEMDGTIAKIRSLHPGHLELLRNSSLIARDGAFVVCHAGINAWLPLDQQSEHDLMWITDGFLDRTDEMMPPVIHGHSIMGDLPVVTENRISLDTGAYESGRLSFLCIDRDRKELDFFQTDGDGTVSMIEPVIHDRGYGSLIDRFEGYANRIDQLLAE
ncbi:hypothetical protein G6L37_35135 [Agrobacterium rubi]|nr:hypothetical protein [Agrobacterium rubi]NTF23805.1 hypothetical protein [Agrobacterium rubi]